MKYKFLIKALLFALIPFIGFSQKDSTLTLSLDGAQQFAIENNLSIENARLDVQAAKKKVWETTAIGLPQANGTLDYQHIPGTIPAFEMMDPTTGETSSIPLGVKNSTTYSITVSQLIFSGEYIVGLQASKTYLQISKLSHEKQELELRSNVLTSYFSILILENNLEIINSSITNLESLVNETKALSDQGFLESTDADQITINLNNLLNAKHTIERQIEVSYKLFKILLGSDLDTKLFLSEDLNTVYSLIIDKSVNPEFDLTNNVDFKMVDNQVRISELSLKREKTKYLPTISAFYNYQDKTNKASFDFTINHIIGAQLNVPIFSSFQRNSVVQQAKINYKKSKNDRILLENSLKAQAEQLRYNYDNALEKYQVAGQNTTLSKKVFNNTSIKYKQGMVSSMDLTQANNTYLQSETDKINALLELLQSKIELEKILNEL